MFKYNYPQKFSYPIKNYLYYKILIYILKILITVLLLFCILHTLSYIMIQFVDNL